eukprot:tig00000217_g19172.t1
MLRRIAARAAKSGSATTELASRARSSARWFSTGSNSHPQPTDAEGAERDPRTTEEAASVPEQPPANAAVRTEAPQPKIPIRADKSRGQLPVTARKGAARIDPMLKELMARRELSERDTRTERAASEERVILLYNVPLTAVPEDILHFFRQVGAEPTSVHAVPGSDYQPTHMWYARFINNAAAHEARAKLAPARDIGLLSVRPDVRILAEVLDMLPKKRMQQPGLTVVVANLPERATPSEVRDFFRGYKVPADGISIVSPFKPPLLAGSAAKAGSGWGPFRTKTALVTLASREEVARAVREKSFLPFYEGGTPITVTVVF